MTRVAAFRTRCQLVPDADVGEGAAHHHFMVSPAGTEGIELIRRHAKPLEVLPGRPVRGDGTGRRDVVGGHRITQHQQHAGLTQGRRRCRLRSQIGEEGRLADVTGCVLPGIQVPSRNRDGIPGLIGGKGGAILFAEHLRIQAGVNRLVHFPGRRPEVPEIDRLPGGVTAQRFRLKVDIHRPGQSIGHHQRRRGQVVGPNLRVDAPFEVPVPGEHRGGHQVILADGFGHGLRQRAAVADAGGAAVTHRLETEFSQGRQQTGRLQVAGDHP